MSVGMSDGISDAAILGDVDTEGAWDGHGSDKGDVVTPSTRLAMRCSRVSNL